MKSMHGYIAHLARFGQTNYCEIARFTHRRVSDRRPSPARRIVTSS
jgi:hypothetical protein